MSTFAHHLETLREELAYGLDLAFQDDDARMYDLLGRTADELARGGEVYEMAVSFTPIANVREYKLDGPQFGRRISQILRVVRDGTELCGIPTIGAYRVTANPTAGTVRYVYSSPDGILLDPAPSVTEAGRSWSVMGLVLANAPLSDGSNDTGLPSELDEHVPLLAMRGALRRATEGEQVARLTTIIQEARRAMAMYRSDSRRDRYNIATPTGNRVVDR